MKFPYFFFFSTFFFIVGVSSSASDYFVEGIGECAVDIPCDDALKQTKALSKISLLQEFTANTIDLLTELMTSAKAEVENSAKSMKNFIPNNCKASHRILKQILNKQTKKLLDSQSELASGVEPMAEHDTDVEYVSETDYPDQYMESSWDTETIYDKPEDTVEIDFIDDRQESNNQQHLHGTTNQRRRPEGNYNQKQPSKPSRRPYYDRKPENTWKKSPDQPGKSFATPYGERWSPNVKNNESKGKENNIGKWRPNSLEKKAFGSRESPEEHENFQKKNVVKVSTKFNNKTNESKLTPNSVQKLSEKVCKGVRGGAFWVPGIDVWCKDNCAQNYCPKTHCVCE